MSDIQLYLLEADKNKPEASRIATETAQKLASKQAKLLELIQSLGEYLNNDDGTIRAKAMAYLSEVLVAIPPKVLNLQHRALLTEFILSRIEGDNVGLGACASGLLALEERGPWDKATAVKVMNTLLEYTHPLPQFRLQSERYPVLQLIDLLLAKYREAISSIHESSRNFLPRFISYFDGEKDPRNLMMVFSILKVPMTEWDVQADAQDLFDAVFNYFPITFKPPPDDPYGITAQELKDRLRDCIAATSDFAPYSFPALLDKLDSTSMNTKRDVLQALVSCAAHYSPRTVSLYAVTLWDALKYEILNVQDEELAEVALDALAEIARQLNRGSADALVSFLKPMSKECNEHLEDAPTKQSLAAGRILRSIASSSPRACDLVLGAILPNLFALYQSADSTAKRRGLLEVLIQLIRASSSIHGAWAVVPVQNGDSQLSIGLPPSNELRKFSRQMLEILSGALASTPAKEISFRLVAAKALLGLTTVRQLLNEEEIAHAISLFDEIILNEQIQGTDELRLAAIDAIVKIARQRPQIVVDKAIPDFLAKLPDTDADTPAPYMPVLEIFAKLGTEPKVFSTVTVRLKNKTNAAIKQKASPTYIKALLATILFAYLNGGAPSPGTLKEISYHGSIVQPMVERAIGSSEPIPVVFEDETILDLVGRLGNTVLRQQKLDIQREKFEELQPVLHDISPKELSKDTPSTVSRKMILATHLYAAMRRDVELPIPALEAVPALVDYVLVAELTPAVRMATLQQISLLVNKNIPASELSRALEPVLSSPRNLASPQNLSQNNLRIIFSILKALVLRNASVLNTLLPTLLQLLSDPTHGITVARGFATLLQPDDILTKQNHCLISGLHKQKLFNLAVPAIAGSFPSADARSKKNHLIALTGILHFLPYAVIEPELVSLQTLLLQAFDLEGEEEVKSATIDTFILVLADNPRVLEEHSGSLIGRLLNLAAGKKNPPRVREKALQCLGMLPVQFRLEIVLPFRRQVVKRLTAALDDRRRAVRAEAVRCRAKWLSLDDAADEDE